jgi:translocation and assembly module TamA
MTRFRKPCRGTPRAAAAVAALAFAARAAATVEIAGVDGALADNVRTYLKLDEEPCDAPQWRVEQQYRAAPAQIRDALQAYGYYEPAVDMAMTRDDGCWHVTLTIGVGEPVRLRRVELALMGDAANDAAFIAARDEAGLVSGRNLEHGAYERLKLQWADLARERGYADARFVANRIDVYPDVHAADVELALESGARYAFGRVELKQAVLTERLAGSYVTFREGEPYDTRRLTEVYGELAASGFFRTIDVRPLAPDAVARTIPVEIALTSAARIQQSYGIGFSTDTGPRLRFGRNNRRYNERGHQFGINAQLSPVISEVTANYRLPLRGSRSEWLNFDTGLKREDTETAESELIELGARRVLERRQDWTRTEMLSLRVEDFEVADQAGRARLLLPGVDWTRIRADNAIRPQQGSRLSLELRAATDAVLSDTSFLQAIARGKWIWSLSRGRRFLVRGEVGVTAKRDFDELPASVRFFAGGDNSVRGYEFKALGPVDAEGQVIGGSALATGSFEFEQPLTPRWSMAIFVDSGNAFESSRVDARTGAGVGARWQSPLGPIRLDVAHPFDDDTTDWRLHVSLGPDL